MVNLQSLLHSRAVTILLLGHVFLLYYILATGVFKSTQKARKAAGGSELSWLRTKEDFASVRDRSVDVKEKLAELIGRRAEPDDPELVAVVRMLMNPPSGHMVKSVRRIVKTPQSKEILDLLKNKKNGFFVEVGALDGERSSNTLFLEQRLGWSGLLIEADPYFYTQLIGKSRSSWSINACIGTGQHPNVMDFKESSGGNGQLVVGNHRGSQTHIRSVPCFALETMLLAINKMNVDYFSLDVEGFELDVLQTIPFDRINITTLSVEYVHGRGGKEQYESFMRDKGYRVHKDIHQHKPEIALFVDDFIFVKESCKQCAS